ncbi:efflux RND transporter periplasmic adaptor subunit [Parendozoicomonas sp. Alg238-R29]|uniref:efflux RND transporter periplasmic adaptor subunit n=1 Tax=Parendozoicomonas sp. Alg238-R29 TaxID=2993446 RepID=UPI00248DC9AA|nr:efflux RND transporter periplasmic adaptor subunit [Parendozoicomonas sp. Alg238-R29]
MNKLTLTLLASTVAFAAGVSVQNFMGSQNPAESAGSGEKEPMYWVAPMDPNYRRDQPGKSPMGMDLVPVYEETSGAEDPAGTVTVSPAVKNSLGVRSEVVNKSLLIPEVRTVGVIGYNEDSIFQVNSRVEGWVENLQMSSNGEFVKAGSRLFDLYSPALVNAQEELVSALRSNRQGLITASRKRLASLDVPEAVIERIVKRGKVERTLAFYAPKDGYVSRLNTREGGYINPSKTIIELAGLDSVWIVADVFERQSQLIRSGQKATMTVEYLPGRKWQGVVDYIYPELNPKTRSLRVRLRFDNPGAELKPNMYSRVAINTGTFEALNIPAEALIQTGQQNRVVKDLGDGKFRSVRVQTGRTVADRVEILRGLAEGDKVVTSAQFLIDSESSVSADLTRYEEPASNRVWMTGVVEDVMDDSLYITHEPVPEWEWPTMSMFFDFGKELDTSSVASGAKVRFEVEKLEGGGFEITAIETSTAAEPVMDHSQMNHEQMDHSSSSSESMPDMDHSKMDHSKMNH